ncbi:MAG: hypothetical protein JOZ10_09460 [Acidobacteria bacterium]|nr:hypothetical protein [Acidobacteriota bacterium]
MRKSLPVVATLVVMSAASCGGGRNITVIPPPPQLQAIGIGVFSQFSAWPMQHAVVLDNETAMSPPKGKTFGALNAGIEVRGFVADSVLADNRIRGRARAALAVDPFKGFVPVNTSLSENRLDDFEAALADLVVGAGVKDTLLLGQEGTLEDQSSVNTMVVPLERSHTVTRVTDDSKQR